MDGVLRSAGEPLSLATLAFYNQRLGHDFSSVRVHTGPDAAESAREVRARAYTVGRHVVLGGGHAPVHAGDDGRLMAHELAHVMQQDGADVPSAGTLPVSTPTAERAAEAAAGAVEAGTPAPVQPRQPAQLAREGKDDPNHTPPPAGRYNFPAPPAPPAPPPVKKESPQPAPPAPPTRQRTKQPGDSGEFTAADKPASLTKWEYIVYKDEVRLGNRAVDDKKDPDAPKGAGRPVIGTLPWMANNPGDLTGMVAPKEEKKGEPILRQDRRVWGEKTLRGEKGKMAEETSGPGSNPLDAKNAAISHKVVRNDLAIFADLDTGRRGLKQWIQKYYADRTLAESVNAHLGYNHVAGVDDPKAYPVRMQQYLNDTYPSASHPAFSPTYVRDTKCSTIQEADWPAVLDAFAVAEGYYSRFPGGAGGKTQYLVNGGVIYNCTRADKSQVIPTFAKLDRVANLPDATPQVIKDMLGCP
jgi:hypothetical protein